MADLLYRLVANFQYRENYGAHDWDGQGECPQYWKFKGGESVTVLVGVKEKSNHYIELVREKMADELDKYIWSNHYSEQYLIGWDWEVASSWTEQEEVDAYCDWHEDLFGIAEELPYENVYFDMAAVCGFEEYA
jgi:hypothetical protein